MWALAGARTNRVPCVSKQMHFNVQHFNLLSRARSECLFPHVAAYSCPLGQPNACPCSPYLVPGHAQFRKAVESACEIRPPVPSPSPLRPLPAGLRAGGAVVPASLPTTEELGLGPAPERDPRSVLHFEGGETAGLKRVWQYIWDEDRLREYKVTRDGLLGSGFSSKFSPWLALGCLSPKTVVVEVCRGGGVEVWVVLTCASPPRRKAFYSAGAYDRMVRLSFAASWLRDACHRVSPRGRNSSAENKPHLWNSVE